MNKELEALEEIQNYKIKFDTDIKYDNGDETQYRFETIRDMFPKQFAIIETALKDHEKITSGDFHIEPINVHIENQKQIKEYEVIKQTKIIVADKKISDDDLDKLENQGMLTDLQCEIKPLFDEETQKKLKALEIIKEKMVNVGLLLRCANVERYNKGICYEPKHLTKEEFDLLKEELENK